jgi:CheY-like chemotaxis protein/anti-sigma regulatory factor (Ser/Thr protein kinase)
LRLQIQIDTTDLVPVAVDAQRLRQILMNLLSNAVKYTERGEVTLGLAMMPSPLGTGRDLRMVVTDSGVGIEPEQLEHIFEPFYHAESPDGRVRQGTGLGLSITRRLVDLMQGSINVTSRRGAGATFRVNIPDLEPASVEASGEGDAPVDFDQLSPLSIVVVDDVEWNLEVAKGYLRDSHHEVTVARDGVEGLEMVRKLQPDVVLMDLRMPRMNGYRAFEAIRADAALSSTRVIAVTASSLAGEDSAQTTHFDGYIRKPYAPLELFATLSDLFGRRGGKPEHLVDTAAVPTSDQHTLAPTVERLAEARNEWRTLCDEPLQALRMRMRMREIGDFTQRLEVLAEEIRDPALQSLVQRLRLATQRFDVNQVKLALDALAIKCDENNDAE